MTQKTNIKFQQEIYLDAIAEFKRDVFWIINVLHLILCMKQESLMKPAMNVKDFLVHLKQHSNKDSGTI